MAGEIGFRLTEADYVAVSRDALWDRVSGRNGPIRAIASMITVPIAVLAIVIYAFRPTPDPVGLTLVSLVVAVPAIYWLSRVAAYLTTSRAARRSFRQSEALQRPFHYSWSGVGLGFETPEGSGLVPWSDIGRWRSTRRSFLFFVDERTIYFIPRCALSEAQIQDLEATLSAGHVPGPPRLEDRLIYP